MSGEASHLYTPAYYRRHQQGSAQSAAQVLGFLFRHYYPQSILDVGCGQGVWLEEAHKLGLKKLVGSDGPWVQDNFVDNPEISLVPCNLEDTWPQVDMGFDLTICLEVAEHLSQKRGRELIKFLCQTSDVILFGAAIPKQGGLDHINEQWPRYWQELFEAQGYVLLDCIRPTLWSEPTVKWWYRQNTFIFINPERQEGLSQKLQILQKPILDMVHPELFAHKLAHLEGIKREHQNQILWPSRAFLFQIFSRWVQIKWNRLFAWFKPEDR